jgi:tRNA (guanine-N7-)-methyltransferase
VAEPTAIRVADEHPEVRTFHPRTGRVGVLRAEAMARLLPRFGVAVTDGVPAAGAPRLLDRRVLFGRWAPLVLEIGSGMGEATAQMAEADPDRDYLAVEVHTPGVANLLTLIEKRGLTNVRVVRTDALELLRNRCAPDLFDAVHIFFPDPWPKQRHHKRRIIEPARVALIRSRLRPGGRLHCATDWPAYAEVMLRTLAADPELVNVFDGYAQRPATRPVTKFEAQGTAAGRPIADLVFVRAGPVG